MTHVGTKCFTSNVASKCTHTLSLLLMTRKNIIHTTHFDYPQSYCYHSSPSKDLENLLVVDILHAKVIKDGSVQRLHVGNYLLNLYVKSHNLDHAQEVFDEIPDRDVRTWTILISGFARIGSSRMVLSLFKDMQVEGVFPNQFTVSSVLKCCCSANEVQMGKGIHGWILCSGIGLDVVLENSILDFYVKCGSFDYAERLFEAMIEKDTVSWNIMIGAYLLIGDTEKSLDLIRRMPIKDVASWNTIIDGLIRNEGEAIALELLYQMVVIGPFV
ncbi:hypothetical protein L1049_020446 [Liquidambar formosana]|uniref:Pentatricopeptide repeat-containing protein n=1 Tax=Liquidambar formosana TaxID=63359 RepID=A0AAP0S766_LIQFO